MSFKNQLWTKVFLILGMVLLSSCFLIDVPKKQTNFYVPVNLYHGYVNNQVVNIPLNNYLPNTATGVCILFWTTMGDAPGGVFWVKL